MLALWASVALSALTPWTQGGLDTGKYRNLLVELGYTEADVTARVDGVFKDVFSGPNKVYFEVGADSAYVSDLKNNDVRTEGMSYGLMAAVQFNRQDIFDKIWRWAVQHMQHHSGAYEGYFAWSCSKSGAHNSEGPASDGELYFVTALIFAANRWGNTGTIKYLNEAQYIMNCAFKKTGNGANNFINTQYHIITFTGDSFGYGYTDPSYNIPAFYSVWAKYLNDGRADVYRDCAIRARVLLQSCVHRTTGLCPDQCNFDGSARSGSVFRFDSWRMPYNVALDYSWACVDRAWQTSYGEKIQNFFYQQGLTTFVDQYNLDGSRPGYVMPAGGKAKLRHSIGLVGSVAAASLMVTHDKGSEFVKHFYPLENKAYDDGYFDAYYDGFLRLFAFMHLSGRYQVIVPK
jgi:oligosaccharide reducing-end xylanase